MKFKLRLFGLIFPLDVGTCKRTWTLHKMTINPQKSKVQTWIFKRFCEYSKTFQALLWLRKKLLHFAYYWNDFPRIALWKESQNWPELTQLPQFSNLLNFLLWERFFSHNFRKQFVFLWSGNTFVKHSTSVVSLATYVFVAISADVIILST